MKMLLFACFVLLAGCTPLPKQDEPSKASAIAGKMKELYSGLSKTTEDTTQVTIAPSGITTNIFHKETRTSPAGDLVKSLGGVAAKGAGL